MSDLIEELDKHLADADPAEEKPETPPEEAPEETPAAEAETETPEAEETPVERDERLTAYLDKYGGDVDKALTAAVEAQELLGRQGSELGELRKEIQALSERIPEQEDDDQYVPIDDSTLGWFDTLMDENPVQAMEWARQNDPSGTYYNRGMAAWFDQNPAQAATYQNAVVANALREEFDERLATQTKPLQQRANQQAEQESFNEAWQNLAATVPDLKDHAAAMLEETKTLPQEMLLGKTAEQKQAVLHTLYRLAKGSAATSLETAKEEAETEQKQAIRAAKLSGTTPQTKAVAAEQVDEAEQWARDFLDPYLADEPA